MPQSFFKLYYHIVWSTKYRASSITPAIEQMLLVYMPGKILKNGGSCLALNMTNDHLHLLVAILPTISVAEFIHKIKGSSSHFINLNLGNKSFYWQQGYGALTLSEKGIPFVKRYVSNQKQHHARSNVFGILEYTPLDEINQPSDLSLGGDNPQLKNPIYGV